MPKAYLNRQGFAAIAMLAVVGATLVWNPVDAAAAQRLDVPQPAATRVASVRDTELEEVFWACDHAATVGMVDANERAACAAVTEQLIFERFGGDFEKMLVWWRANKPLEHQRLDGSGDSNTAD